MNDDEKDEDPSRTVKDRNSHVCHDNDGSSNGMSEKVSEEKQSMNATENACDPEVQKRIRSFLAFARKTGKTFNGNLVSKKDFGNPYLLSTIVSMFEIDENGSNFPADKFDPSRYPPGAFYDKLGWAPSTLGRHSRGKIEKR